MAIKTTTIGAYPKPEFLDVSDWFDMADGGPDGTDPTAKYLEQLAQLGEDAEQQFIRAAQAVIDDQVEAGIDIVTDGEVRRENYIHYHCRHIDGINFDYLTETAVRGGNYSAKLPTITGPVKATAPFLPHDWKAAQALTDRPVKITVPGPMTIGDTVADDFYDDPKKRGADLAVALNSEILALADAGAIYIQVDEPVFARKADQALDFGFENLERCFHGLPDSVIKTVHMCCGYPDRLDNPNYTKAPKESYFQLAPAIEGSCIQAVSVEDAHRNNDLSLLEMFKTTTVIFGVVAIAKSEIESVEQIRSRLSNAVQHIDPERLIAAPDCGLGLLGRDLTRAKLGNLCKAAAGVG
jgi:5-methyltetrahydropteroyltriglutamate--homocysteine methyltransferase